MNSFIQKLDTFHKTRQGYVVFFVLEAILLYIFASIAIDTANMWAYLAAIVLLVGTILNLINAIKTPKGTAHRR